MTRPRLFVVGVGGFGREVAAIVSALGRGDDLAGFVDDAPSDGDRERARALGLDVVDSVRGLASRREPFEAVIAVGSNASRRTIDGLLAGAPVRFPVLVHPDSTVGSRVSLGPGTVVAPGARLSTNIEAGRHVHLDQNAVVGHDSALHDYSRVNPNGCVSGAVRLGAGALVGASATILQGLTVGADAVVGAGAVVVADVPAGAVVKGVPAR
ncbi:NeuD/PglB/VioB family sugar acetyltransferase [Oryzobacter sp. R7]|uniref:NeuD/PglB/VioB family sugar acetyltransferase n=1 Tax=Oryzobacter faecalis TaxID=3388656 RepID=UPI00398CDD76